MNAFESLPGDARLWLFASDRDLDGATADALLARVRAFTETWTSHGRPVAAAAELLNDRVLAVAGAISTADLNAGVSGCGIDAMTHAVDSAAEAAGIRWLQGLDVAYHDGSAWRVVPRPDFRALARAGAVTPATVVLDLTPTTVDELRDRGVVRSASEAWHGAAFWTTRPVP